jgi:20S proteasome alpha/beta subunit
VFSFQSRPTDLVADGSILGLTADGRILIDKARIQCQSHRLTVEDPVSIEYITKHVAGIQQVSQLESL